MLKTLVWLALGLIVAVLLLAATRPDRFHVERSVSIQASAEKIFPLINDFHQWDNWTPYNKDPAMKKSFGGSASGKGATYAWEGNGEVGQGNIEITESTSPTRIALNLNMIKPFEGRNQVVFSINTADKASTVTWGMDGSQNFVVKVMGLFFSMDQMVGKDFEVGLGRLKGLAEK
jgi:hypothetical protein